MNTTTTTTNTTAQDFTGIFTDVEQHILISRAIVKATMNAMPDTPDMDDAGLLIGALMDQLDLAHKALTELWDVHAERKES